jgi:hypothetical protein
MKNKITSSEIKLALESFKGTVKKIKSGDAEGATRDGSICAASFGSSLLGRERQRAVYFQDQKQKKEMKRRKHQLREQKPKVKSPATEAQIRYMEDLGLNFKKDITKFEARNLLSQIVRLKNETKKD